MTGNIKIRQYMLSCVEEHVDPLTGEVNDTYLAEDACQHFNDYEGDDIPEKYFECAHEIASQHEIKTGVREGRTKLSGLINSLDASWF